MRAPGEIRQLARIVGAQVGLVTTIGESHLERLGSVQAIADAKGELVEELAEGGVAVLPRDSEWFGHLAAKARGRVVSFGRHPESDVRVATVRPLGFGGSETELEVAGRVHRFIVPQMGRTQRGQLRGRRGVGDRPGPRPGGAGGFRAPLRSPRAGAWRWSPRPRGGRW